MQNKTFIVHLHSLKMVVVAQLVRVLVCGAEGRRFEPGQPPKNAKASKKFEAFFVYTVFLDRELEKLEHG